MRFIILAISFILSIQFGYSQYCAITVTPMDTTVCEGASVLIAVNANILNSGQAFDFNSGLPGGWSTGGGASFSQPCGPGVDNTPYYWAATAGSGTPQISTPGFDASCGGTIEFDMVYSIQGGGSPCEGPDLANEGVSLQYSTDGGLTWIDIIYFSPGGFTLPANPGTSGSVASGVTPYTSWNNFVVPIPPGAMGPNTMFQWIQLNSSGSSFDNWGIDNVVVNTSGYPCNASTVINWTNGVMDTDSLYYTATVDTNFVALVYDSLGNFQCASDTIYVNVSPQPVINAGPDQTACVGVPFPLSGTIFDPNNVSLWLYDASQVNPAPTVNFSPNNMNVNPTVTVNQPGLYYFILREDDPVCGTVYDTLEVIASELSIVASQVSPSCEGASDGEIHVTCLDADEYSFDGGLTWVADSFDVVFNAGVYTVCAKNTLGCEKCINVNVVDPAPVVVSVSNDSTICENGTGYLSASATGGTSYQFHWDHTGDTSPNQSVNPSVNTTYTVIAENQNGCMSQPESIDITLHPPLSGTISPLDTICPGYPTTVFANASGGIGQPYTFTWSSGETQTGPAYHEFSANPPVTTTYTVTITDQCETTPYVIETEVWVAPLPVPEYEILDPEQCEPAVFHIVNTTDPALSQYNYWWIEPNQEFLNQDTIVTDSMWAGHYDMQMIITSYHGCIDSLTFDDALEVKPKPVADFRHTPNPVLMFNTDVLFTNYSINGYTYQWSFEEGYPATSTQTNVTVQFPDGQTGSYDVQLITTSELGCVDTMDYELVVFPEVLIYAPNTFTPDGDEFNQNWRIFMEGIDFYDFELLIYNRWGELIWESHDIEVPWDGTYNGELVPSGTYTWVVRASDALNDGKYTYKGHVTLLK